MVTSRGASPSGRRRRGWLLGVVAAMAVTAVAPTVVVLGAGRSAALVVMVAGAGHLVRRLGMIDLAVGAAAGAGAYAGGVTAGVAGVPMAVGLVLGGAAGGLVSATAAALAAATSRTVGALTSLAVGIATVAGLRALPGSGGAAGFHAVPLLTPGDRATTVVALLLAATAVRTVAAAGGSVAAARGGAAVRAGAAAAALGRRPALDAAVAAATGGAVVGLGSALDVALSGSVVPSAYGLPLTAALLLGALVGGAPPFGPVVGAAVLWGPSLLWPLVPVVGTAPVLMTTGLVALVVLAWRPQGLVSAPTGRRSGARARPWSVPSASRQGPAQGPGRADPGGRLAGAVAPAATRAVVLEVEETEIPEGTCSLELRRGEIVALAGRNGAGKSTVLARIGGQLPDHRTVRAAGGPLPRGAPARARRGIGRTWQRPPVEAADDLDRIVGLPAAAPDVGPLARAVAAALGDACRRPAARDLVRLAAVRPAVALVDEPAATLPPSRVAQALRHLADDGVAVLVAEHRREVLDVADRVVVIGAATREAPPDPVDTTTPRRPVDPATPPPDTPRLRVTVGDREVVAAAPGDLVHAPAAVIAALVDAPGTDPTAVEIDGTVVPAVPLAARVAAGLAPVGRTDLAPAVAVRDHLAALVPARDADRLLAGSPLLAGRGADPAGVLSGGERRVLSWLRAVAVRPRVVVLDHATDGLDADALAWARQQVADWLDAGVVVVHGDRPGFDAPGSRRRP